MVSGRNKLFLTLREHWKPQNIKMDLPEYGETAIKINGKRKPHTCRGESPNPALFYYTHVRESKTVSLGFWITRHGFQALDSWIFDSETWIPDLNHKWDSGFLELYSKFQSPGIWILQFKLSDSRFQFTSKNFLDCLNYSTWGEFYCPRKLGDVRTNLSELSSTESRQKHHFNSDYVTNTPTIHGQVSKSLVKALTFSRNSTRA